MSTTTTEPTKPAEATEEDKIKTVVSSLDGFGKTLYFGPNGNDGVKADVDTFNSKVALLITVGGDAQALLENLRETSTDPKVIELKDQINKLQDALLKTESARDEILKAEVAKVQSDNAGSGEAITAELDALTQRLRPGIAYMEQITGKSAAELGLKLARRSNRSNSTKLKAPGEGGRRVRGYDISVNGKLAQLGTPPRSNMAAAAKAIGVETKVVQEAFFAIAGTDTDKFPETVTFDITKDDTVYNVSMVKIPAGAE